MQEAPLILSLLVVAFASARVAVLLAHDTILERPRDWFYRQRPPVDNPMLGFDYQQRDTDGTALPDGLIRSSSLLGELFTCTRCLTVWTTPPLAFLYVSSSVGRDIVTVVAVMGLASLLAKKV